MKTFSICTEKLHSSKRWWRFLVSAWRAKVQYNKCPWLV